MGGLLGYGVKTEQIQKIITNKMNRLPVDFLYIAGAPINNTFWQLSHKGYIMVSYMSGSIYERFHIQVVPNKRQTVEGVDGHGAGDGRSGTPYGGRRQPGI